MDLKEIKVKFFGRSKELAGREFFLFNLNKAISIKDFKLQLVEALDIPYSRRDDFVQLLQDSAIGDESKILNQEDKVFLQREIVILPPVCGG